MKILSILLLISLASSAFALRWTGVNADGQAVVRGFRVLKAPPLFQDTFSIVAFQVSGQGKNRQADAVQFLFTTNVIPRFVVRHFARDGDSAEKQAARLGLRKIVEYVENGTNAGFDPNEDILVQSYYLWNQTWLPLEVSRTVNADGADVNSICAKTADGVVSICAFATSRIGNIKNGTRQFETNPNAFTHTFEIKNFPFKQTNSKLALKTHLDVFRKAIDMTVQDPTALQTGESALDLGDGTDTDARPALSWKDTVDVTGTGCSATAPVVRSVVFDKEQSKDIDVQFPGVEGTLDVTLSLTRKIVYHSFLTDCATPTDIFWDPDFGVVATGNSMILIPSLFLIIALLFVSLF